MSGMMDDIGLELREAREALGLGVEALADELCICSRQLRALENNQHDKLPGTAYVIGFLRTYARRLGLDGNRIVDLYKDLPGGPTIETVLNFPEPIRETRIPAMSLMVAGSLALVGMYAGWSSLTGNAVQEASVVPAPPAHLAAMIAPDSGTASESTNESINESAPELAVMPEKSTPDQPAAEIRTASVDQTPDVTVAQKDISGSLVSSVVASEATPGMSSVGASRIQVQANTDTWIMITDQDDRLIMEGIIRSGERYAPPAVPGLKLSTSNAGGLEMYVDGRSSGELGEWGDVAESVPLEFERIASLIQ